MKQLSDKINSDRDSAINTVPILTKKPTEEASMATGNPTNSNPLIQIKERPIPFTGESVRAILDGRKTQTRRVVKFLPEFPNAEYVRIQAEERKHKYDPVVSIAHEDAYAACPYGKPGDRLWVRECFAEAFDIDNSGPEQSERRIDHQYIYKADGEPELFFDEWKPSIFMYRAASRINLEITNVRVERLQDISNEDIRAEGIGAVVGGFELLADVSTDPRYHAAARKRFEGLWDAINGKKHPWSSNPWVWVIEFKKI